MAESQSNFQIPWASLAVVATFVSGTLLLPHAFDLLRPPEKERAQATVGSDLEVDARLWEDPFVAVRRHEAERAQRCDKDKDSKSRDCSPTALAGRRAPSGLLARLDVDRDKDADEALVLAVMVPGNPFVGAEEARRRTRYAVLAGLQAERYLPDSAEHVGVLHVDMARPVEGQAGEAPIDRLLVPYELLSERRNRTVSGRVREGRPHRAVAVLWIDESALPSPKLDGLAHVLHAVIGDCKRCPQLALIGPSSSDGLRLALSRLRQLAGPPAPGIAPLTEASKAGLGLIANAAVYNSAATLVDERLGVPDEGDLQSLVRDRLQRILALPTPPPFRYESTLASDDKIMNALAAELLARLDPAKPRRVVTIIESDPIFTRPLEADLRRNLRGKVLPTRPEDRVYFFRGVDGVTARDATVAARDASAKKDADAPTAVEWPESRDQLDYLRRMAAELRRSETVPYPRDGVNAVAEPIGAIGIFAYDVHDKLLILQALHESFPDKVFFTSDMDARLVHPRTLPFTRNLIVASSLPLQFPIVPPKPAENGVQASPTPRQLHAGTPPFRDVYQASNYAAARLAACTQRCAEIHDQLRKAIQQPSVYEIGRDSATALAGLDFTQRRALEPTTPYATVLLLGTALLLTGLLVWPSTPALRIARQSVMDAHHSSREGLLASSALTAVYGFWLGVLAGSLVEALQPGRLGFAYVVAWGLIAAVASLFVYPGLRLGTVANRSDIGGIRATGVALLLVLLALAAAMLLAPPSDGPGEPLVWLQGISAWPSHFINLGAVLSGVIALDVLWSIVRRARDAEIRWLAMPGAAGVAATSARSAADDMWPWLREGVSKRMLMGWRPQGDPTSVDVADVWRRYEQRAGPGARAMRILFWYVLTVITVVGLFVFLSDQALPEVPVRGQGHRALIEKTMWAALLLLPLVVVAVADATMLAWRLIMWLASARSVYPRETVTRFAAELGAEHAAVWSRAIAADPDKRDAAGASAGAPQHSLLDDWIDIRIIARHTRTVAPLVVAPFIMLTLMVLARSRLFDNWALTWPVAAAVALYVVWMGLLAVLLKQAAEAARTNALRRMNADLRWLQGGDAKLAALVAPMQRLIATVETERRGAFAAPFDQWFFKGLLVPLGGAGGAQLIERLMMAR